jgi:lysylphosphatidylglycerol synthetase-like protein (DUF2156 family)
MVGLPGPLQYVSARAENRTDTILVLLGLTVVALTLAAALRPAGGPHPIRADESARVRELLAAYGGNDSLGYFALRDDKAVVFSPSLKSAVAYRVLGGVSLAAGDPLGDVEACPGRSMPEQARTYAWIPGGLGASERAADVYRRFGLDALELGDEAVINVADFSLDGRPMRAVRQSVGRLQRKVCTWPSTGPRTCPQGSWRRWPPVRPGGTGRSSTVLAQACQLGVTRMSLNFAVFAPPSSAVAASEQGRCCGCGTESCSAPAGSGGSSRCTGRT